MKRWFPFAVIILVGAAPAAAFDCARAVSDIEIAICSDEHARQTNERMERAYFATRDRLDEAGRKQLLEGQRAWLRYRDNSCGAEPACLGAAAERHAETLESMPAGTIPFTHYQKGGAHSYDVLIEGSHFLQPWGPGEGSYEAWLRARIDDTPLGKPEDDEEEHLPYTHELSIELPYLGDRLISAVAYSYDYSGGAHPNGWTTSINIDRADGKALTTGALFGSGEVEKLTADCQRQIVEWYSDSYENMSQDEAIAELEKYFPGTVAEHVGDMTRWHFEGGEAVIRFDSYAVAPYAAGPAECRFADANLRAMSVRPELLPQD